MGNSSRACPSGSCSCLIVCSSPNGRGIHQYALELERGIACSSILAPRENERFVFWEIFGIVRDYRKLRSAERLVFANTRITPLLWGALKRQTLLVVVHDLIDTVLENGYRDYNEGWFLGIRRRINSWFLVQSIGRADVVIANSETTRLQLQESGLLKSSRVVVVRPGPSFGREITHWDEIINPRMGDQVKAVHILAVAGRSKNKCVDDYFEMLEVLVGMASINAKMTIVGISKEELSDHSKAIYIKYRKRIEVVRRVESRELLDYYLCCDVYVSLSSQEGYGIPVADAVGFDIPVVARDIPPFREISSLGKKGSRIILCRNVMECSRVISENYRLWVLGYNVFDARRREERIEKYWKFRRSYEEYLRCRLNELWVGSGEK